MEPNSMTLQPDYDAIKSRQQSMWGSGDYASVAALIVYMSERMCEDIHLSAGQTVLDVATGSGNAAIAAARRGAVVTGSDYQASLLEHAKRRSDAEHVEVRWQLADAESLPYENGAFDIVTSVVGVMFAPNQEQAAHELIRVCKPGGKIVTANWTPDGFVGRLLKTVGQFVPPPAGLKPAVRWGTEEGMQQLLGSNCELRFARYTQVFRLETAESFAQLFIEKYGPTERAHASLDAPGQRALFAVLLELASQSNEAHDGTVRISAEYLETTAIRG